MPKYVYQGLETGNHYEFEQRFHDEAYTHHPENGEPIKRLIFAPAVVFKGSGWYAKDSKASAKPQSKAETNTEAKSETKSETPKPESKPTPSSSAD